MAKYKDSNGTVVDAFQLGVEPEPSWFVKNREEFNQFGFIAITRFSTAPFGDYVMQFESGVIKHINSDEFQKQYEPI